MTTTARRPARAHKQAAAPFSPAATKLIAQLQAEARAQLLADLSSKDAITVLHGFDADTRIVRAHGENLDVRDDKGNRVDLYRRYQEPKGWREAAHMEGYWHPARWYGSLTLVDANGTKWERDLGVMVCDDFGNLVEVPER